jgi:hypothetical protein
MSINYNENNKKTYKEIYTEEVELYNDIYQRYGLLQENDISGAYRLMKDSLQAYNRWSVIREDIRKSSSRGNDSHIKDRLKEILEYLYEVHTDSRIIFTRAKEDYMNNRE